MCPQIQPWCGHGVTLIGNGPFPVLSKNVKVTKIGLIGSDGPEAIRWSEHKTRSEKGIEPGQRWLNRSIWAALGRLEYKILVD
jgi:hypothetical protein